MNKKIMIMVLPLIILSLIGCNKTSKNTIDNSEYGVEKMVEKFYETGEMIKESVLLVSENGEPASAKLGFMPTSKVIIEDPSCTLIYEEGKDYVINGRVITLTNNSSMPYINKEVLYGINMPSDKGLSTQPVSSLGASKGYSNVLYTEGTFLYENQVLVSYKFNKEEIPTEAIPKNQKSKLTNTINLLENKNPLQIISYGDSIATGCNSTGGGMISIYDDAFVPFGRFTQTPTYPELVSLYLMKKYNTDVSVFSAAKGGENSSWAYINSDRRCVNPDFGYEPDLVIISLGINDATNGISLDTFESNIRGTIERIREASTKPVEFILIGPMMTNEDAIQANNNDKYNPIMEKISNEVEGVAFAEVTGIHKYLLQNKIPSSMLSNNVNHPTDFIIRLYAMAILSALE